MAAKRAVFIGIGGKVLALNPSTGEEIWRTALKGADMINIALMEGRIFASTRGELYALDPATGKIQWRNKLKGLGHGFVSIAGAEQTSAMARQRQAQQQAAAAGAAAVVAASS